MTTERRGKARFDSRPATHEHIQQVQALLGYSIADLLNRALVHDASKLTDPELAAFDEFSPRLAASTYGSKEYAAYLEEMKPILAHHYEHNSHHPEHHADGIAAAWARRTS